MAACPSQSVELTEAEWTIIKAVWETEPCTAPDIQEKAAAANGVDLFDRAHADGPHGGQGPAGGRKGAATSRIYRSAVTREQAQRGELFYALKHAFNGALTPMVQCLLDTATSQRRGTGGTGIADQGEEERGKEMNPQPEAIP